MAAPGPYMEPATHTYVLHLSYLTGSAVALVPLRCSDHCLSLKSKCCSLPGTANTNHLLTQPWARWGGCQYLQGTHQATSKRKPRSNIV